MSVRSDVAAAASTVTDVNVTPGYRQTIKPGEGFVKWSGRQRDDSGLGWIDTWQVWIAVPATIAEADKWLTEHLDALIAAIDTELVVTTAQAVDLLLGATATSGLIIEGTRPAA